MKSFEVKETLYVDENTGDIISWVVKDTRSDKIVFLVENNMVLIADEDYMEILIKMLKNPFMEKEDDDYDDDYDDDPYENCHNNCKKMCCNCRII